MIVAARGSYGDPEGLGLQDVEEGGRSGAENNKSQSQHDQ
jgi:hypothetical protein